ncbi:MAG TPA: hypothetical protein VGI79_04535 [Caulobacteraceae bacterium]
MPLASLLALALIASDPDAAPPAAQAAPPPAASPAASAPPAPDAESAPMATQAPQAPPPTADAPPQAIAAAATSDDWDEIPSNAPRDDYGLVSWCYGALDEYLTLYEVVKPDLKAIDKMFGTPVVEAEPYHDDIAEDRKALKRFAGAIEAAEKASARPIAPEGAAAMESGRHIWAAARLEPRRRMADAWLFWGVPTRCDKVAKTLKVRATLMGQAFAVEAPKVDGATAPAATPETTPALAPAPVGIDASDLAAPAPKADPATPAPIAPTDEPK